VKRLVPTAEMTLGPFFPREFAQGTNDLAPGAAEAIEIIGRVTELDGKPLTTWCRDLAGRPCRRFDNPKFVAGRAATDGHGEYRFRPDRAVPARAAHQFPRPLLGFDAPAAP
jgi:protocatechuate 3,4-dioxygenase beta subunit